MDWDSVYLFVELHAPIDRFKLEQSDTDRDREVDIKHITSAESVVTEFDGDPFYHRHCD